MKRKIVIHNHFARDASLEEEIEKIKKNPELSPAQREKEIKLARMREQTRKMNAQFGKPQPGRKY